MKKDIKRIFPAFLSLFILLSFEVIDNIASIKQKIQVDIQFIGNVLILMIACYSIWNIVIVMKEKHKYLQVYYLNICLIILSAFLLNIYVFENRIKQFTDVFTNWHTIWFMLSFVLFLWFTGIVKKILEVIKRIVQCVINGANHFKHWLSDVIRNSHKGVIAVVSIGIFFWIVSLLFINERESEFSIELLMKESVVFWCGWFMICILIFFFVIFLKKISQMLKDIKSMKVFLWIMIGLAVLGVILYLFPSILSLIGKLLAFPIIISLLLAAAIHFGKEKLFKMIMVNWKDVAVVCGVFVLVTFVLLPVVGVVSEEGQSISSMDSIENFKTFMELITVGIEFIKEVL